MAHNLVMLTVGTGVGGGLVLGGRIYRGATGGAGELGHTIVGLDRWDRAAPEPLAFPQPSSLEFAAAERAPDRLAARAHVQLVGATLRGLVADRSREQAACVRVL